MITEAKLQALKFNKIVWNRTIPDYWLPLHKPTGDQLTDRKHRLGIMFNERKDEPGPMVYLAVMSSMMRLPHIKLAGQLIQLYELLAGHSFTVGDG